MCRVFVPAALLGVAFVPFGSAQFRTGGQTGLDTAAASFPMFHAGSQGASYEL